MKQNPMNDCKATAKCAQPPPGMRLSHPVSPGSTEEHEEHDEEDVRVLTSPTIREELDQLSLASSFDSFDRQQLGLRASTSSYDSVDPERQRSYSLDSEGRKRLSHGKSQRCLDGHIALTESSFNTSYDAAEKGDCLISIPLPPVANAPPQHTVAQAMLQRTRSRSPSDSLRALARDEPSGLLRQRYRRESFALDKEKYNDSFREDGIRRVLGDQCN
eukprot:gene26014-31414_t